MRLQLTSFSLSTDDPPALCRFYARLLDAEPSALEEPSESEPGGWGQLQTTSDRGRITINFEYEPKHDRIVWPSEPGKPQVQAHLDILVDDLAAAVAWAEECGATQAETQPSESLRVLIDPAGHPFCLFTD